MSGTTNVEQAPAKLWQELGQVYRWCRFFVLLFTLLFFVVLVNQAYTTYQWASTLHPAAGYTLLVALGLGFSWLLGVPIWAYWRTPRVVEPPPLPASGQTVQPADLQKEVRYLERYLANAQRNPEYANQLEQIKQARQTLQQWQRELKSNGVVVADWDRRLQDWTGKEIPAILQDVDQRADRLIYQEALAVGVATAVSPNGTLDAFLMLWRSLKLTSKLAVLYYGRPGLWGTLTICRDVAVATAVAGQLQSVAQSLGGLIGNYVKGVGGLLIGPATEAATNAVVLIRIGFLAKQRCRSFRQWDTATRTWAIGLAFSATQKMAASVIQEIFRQAGVGISSVADVATKGASAATNAAMSGMAVMTNMAKDFSTTFSNIFRGRNVEPTD